MVNVPPALLCSTPPPIDFGDEDDEIDVLPPTLGGSIDEEFGDFSVGDNKSEESLPSPSEPDLPDLPHGSVYDEIVPPDETYTTQTTPPIDVSNSKNDLTNKSQNTPIIEAFNYSITHQTKDEEDVKESTTEISTEALTETKNPTSKNEVANKILLDVENVLISSSEQVDNDDDKINDVEQVQTVPCVENSRNGFNRSISLLTNMVSIEDLEDDLSEDELYSPRTPKNVAENEAIESGYFKIHNIENDEAVLPKISKTTEKDTPGDASADNAFSNVENKPFSKFNFSSEDFNLPPPLDDQANCMAENEDDDDEFGDFADFQEFANNTTIATTTTTTTTKTQSPVNSSVPVNEDEIKNLNVELQANFNDYVQHTDATASSKIKSAFELQQVRDSPTNCSPTNDYDFDDFASHAVYVDNIDDDTKESVVNETCQSDKSLGTNKVHEDNYENTKQTHENIEDSFADFSDAQFEQETNSTEVQKQAEILEDDEQNVDNREEDYENLSNNDDEDDDDFNEFVDSKAQNETLPIEKLSDDQKKIEDTNTCNDDEFDDDDDDFGDFNTAEPITTTTITAPTTQSSQILTNNTTSAASIQQPSKNLNERISKILQLMFASSDTISAENTVELKTQKIQDIPFTSIDAAKALEYQWMNSETRHSFIKSLGIDSRNILYGENWNPSLPRFAANLSFNPLKPMKPVTTDAPSCPSLDPVNVNNGDFNKPIINHLANSRRDNIEIDWKSTAASSEQTTEAEISTTSNATTLVNHVLYVTAEPPEPMTMFENDDEKLSKTPPISEMESVNSFSSTLPTIANLETDLPPPTTTQIINDFKNMDFNEADADTLQVVASTTFSGSFKETHIYTPPKTTEHTSSSSSSSTSTTSPSKAANIDFDYEKAAMGVIINETVVKKEYRDIEYNSPFSMDANVMKTSLTKSEVFEAATSFCQNLPNNVTNNFSNDAAAADDDDFNDEFSDFQSVPTEATVASPAVTTSFATISTTNRMPGAVPGCNTKHMAAAAEITKSSNVSSCGMILSPAILIPQAISMESNKPKIEWGDSTASINPDELARIEELFPEPKLNKSSHSNSSQKSTPTHQPVANTPSISATVASKELDGNDDDDWSDFVSVPITNNNRITNNNNTATNSAAAAANSPFKQRSPANAYKIQNYNNSNNDDEWSDFVSSAPTAGAAQGATHRLPQFNSGAWQNANFYNNPLSLYHKGPLNMHSVNQQQSPKNYLNNNNNYNHYNHIQSAGTPHSGQQQQQIHIMQNFSTAPVPTPERHIGGGGGSVSASAKNNQFQVGSAKVAPSIALIPDLGFVAPAVPTHTSFISSLPKPSLNAKK